MLEKSENCVCMKTQRYAWRPTRGRRRLIVAAVRRKLIGSLVRSIVVLSDIVSGITTRNIPPDGMDVSSTSIDQVIKCDIDGGAVSGSA